MDVSEDCNSFIFRVKQFRMKAQQEPHTKQHSVTSQKT